MKMATHYCAATIALLSTIGVHAALPEESGPGQPQATAPAMTMTEIIELLQQQQKDLAEQQSEVAKQKLLLEAQSLQIATLTEELDNLRKPPPLQEGQVVVKTEAPEQTAPPVVLKQEESDAPQTEQERKTKASETVAKTQEDDPTRDLLADFTGAWRLPGTSAALRIGGYVKASIVNNFDALEIKDRFIVGSIPVGDERNQDIKAQSSITASQSRLNFDLREPTDVGILRAFMEGDFAGDDETFRLRHAFGQWDRLLAGKTWSAFVDTAATPEEVDFEGLNGRVSVRQSQVRLIPTLGKEYEFQLSLEDPNPEIQNGQGVTKLPDIVASGRFEPHRQVHVKFALLGRQIRGQRAATYGGGIDKEIGWGMTLSGRVNAPVFDPRDSVLFQFNYGSGIGRYINDLSSVGNFDGIFNPTTGNLELFDIKSGYISAQHWWPWRSVRSNFTFGYVGVDNPGFVEGDAYKRTLRFSSNLLWSPTPRIDIGAEYLWGNRKNEDGDNSDATQIQLAARYWF